MATFYAPGNGVGTEISGYLGNIGGWYFPVTAQYELDLTSYQNRPIQIEVPRYPSTDSVFYAFSDVSGSGLVGLPGDYFFANTAMVAAEILPGERVRLIVPNGRPYLVLDVDGGRSSEVRIRRV